MLPLVLAIAIAADSAERTFPVTTFHAVDLATKATVRVEQAADPRVTVSGDPRLVRCVTANVRADRLVIGWAGRSNATSRASGMGDDIVVMARTDCPHASNPQRLVIRVAAPSIDKVALRDLGFIQVLPMSVPTFAAIIYERGSITIGGLHAGATRLAIAGIGRIAATGDLGRLGIAVGGHGAVDTRAGRADAVDVSIAGKGDVLAIVDGPATGSLGGTGSITIGGHPLCQIRNPGGGRITCRTGS